MVVRRDGRLVAGAALVARRRLSATVLTPVGSGLSDYQDVLVDDECAAEATRWLTVALLADRRWDHVEFSECRPGSAARRLHDSWPGPRWRGVGFTCVEIPVAPLADTLATLPGSTAKSFRRLLRKIDALGLEVTYAPAEQIPDAVRELLDLHRRQWHGRPDVNPEHLSARFAQHMIVAVRDLVRTSQAMVVQYRLSGRVVASELLFVWRDVLGAYLSGYDPALRERISVNVMMESHSLALAQEMGRPTLSLLRGDEPYKLRWRPRLVPNERLVLARPGSLRGAARPLYLKIRTRAVRLARRRCPRLLTVVEGLVHRTQRSPAAPAEPAPRPQHVEQRRSA